MPSGQEYHAKWYADNRDKRLEQMRVRRDAISASLRAIKESSPCADCGKFFPSYVMDYDHLDGSTKLTNVAKLKTWKWILAEIAKCELVCANCHRVRTWTRALVV